MYPSALPRAGIPSRASLVTKKKKTKKNWLWDQHNKGKLITPHHSSFQFLSVLNVRSIILPSTHGVASSNFTQSLFLQSPTHLIPRWRPLHFSPWTSVHSTAHLCLHLI